MRVAAVAARNAELEQRAIERTAQLQVAVSNLHAQVSRRTDSEAALRESEAVPAPGRVVAGVDHGYRSGQTDVRECRGATVAAARGQRVLISVADDGRGIPADKLQTIFQRFHRVDASDSREKGGTGLGLAIYQTIVQQHGGRVWAESTLGVGSTFYVELRSATPPAAAA